MTELVTLYEKEFKTGVSSAEFHNIQQDMEKYCKLRVAIRRQSEAKVRQIPKKARRIAWTRNKEKQERLFPKILSTLGIQDVNDIESMQRLSPKVYNFAV